MAGSVLKDLSNDTTADILLMQDHLLIRFKFFKHFQVLGNAKGAVAVVISILIFKNPVSFIGMAGYGLTVVGVVIYSEAKKRFR